MKQYSVLSVEGNVASDTGAVLLSAITSNVANNATGFFSVPSGTTAQRPASPVNGMLRYNTTTLRFEFYANGGWRNMARLDGDTFTGAVIVKSSGATIGNAFSIQDSSNNKKFEVFDTASGNSYAAIRRTANTADTFFIIYPQGTLTTSNVNWNFGLRANSNDFNITTYDGASVVNRLAISNTGNATFGGNVISSQFRISALNTAPSSATDTGTLGEIRYDTNYMYVCVATNTWKRSPLTTW